MTPIEQELSEIEDRSERNVEGLRRLKYPIDKELRMLNENEVILKLINFIRHQADVIAKKDAALESINNTHCTAQHEEGLEALAIKARESLLEGGE